MGRSFRSASGTVTTQASGRRFSPFTVRRLVAGKGIGLHHDLHTSLEMFKEVAPGLDRRTLVSYVFTLQGPEAGGELCVYNCPPDVAILTLRSATA